MEKNYDRLKDTKSFEKWKQLFTSVRGPFQMNSMKIFFLWKYLSYNSFSYSKGYLSYPTIQWNSCNKAIEQFISKSEESIESSGSIGYILEINYHWEVEPKQLSKRRRECDDEEKKKTNQRQSFEKLVQINFRVDLVLNFKQFLFGNYSCPIYTPFNNFTQMK